MQRRTQRPQEFEIINSKSKDLTPKSSGIGECQKERPDPKYPLREICNVSNNVPKGQKRRSRWHHWPQWRRQINIIENPEPDHRADEWQNRDNGIINKRR